MMGKNPFTLRIILDYDGTLTREEEQAGLLRERSLDLLAGEILHLPRPALERDYEETRRLLLAEPARHGWIVDGQLAAYCDEGAFLLNTATMQAMLAAPAYRQLLEPRFAGGPYDPIMACVNWMFHELTFDLPPFFRADAGSTLRRLLDIAGLETVVLTNSKGDKVRRTLAGLGIPLLPAEGGENPGGMVRILGDVRQYDMAHDWGQEETPQDVPQDAPQRHREHRGAEMEGAPQRRRERRGVEGGAAGGAAGKDSAECAPLRCETVLWADESHPIDLRRPVYYRALQRERADVRYVGVVADGLSLAGSLPLALGLPFFLIQAPYTPAWVSDCVRRYACGVVLDELGDLVEHLLRVTREVI